MPTGETVYDSENPSASYLVGSGAPSMRMMGWFRESSKCNNNNNNNNNNTRATYLESTTSRNYRKQA
jgi:hypothetical protein